MPELKQKLEKIVADLKNDLAGLRTGRASPALVEHIAVEAYGSRQPLKAIAAISAPGPREVLIQPWDKSLLAAIEKAIQGSHLGVMPIVDQETIRLTLPFLTDERKREYVKILKDRVESARIQVRRARDETMKVLEKSKEEGARSEDQVFREKQEVGKTISEYNKMIETLGQTKEKEISEG